MERVGRNPIFGGGVKINVDAAFKGVRKVGAWVERDCGGRVLVGEARRVECASAVMAEARVVLEGC